MGASIKPWHWLLAALVLFGAVHWLRHRPIHPPPGVLVADDPVQATLDDAKPFEIDDGRYRIQPLASFDITARVLSVENYHLDRMAPLVPTDLALGWGPMSDSAVLADIDIDQGDRFYFWHVDHFPIERRDIEIHSANMHLIPADAHVRREISQVRIGQVVHFAGDLVEVKAQDGWTLRSSLTREDTGPGACEVVWVTDFELR